MALKIRLRQQGRNNRQFYRMVVTDVRAPRDGKYVESLGWYNPMEKEDDKVLSLNSERIQYWLSQGAELSESAQSLVAKGAPTVLRQHSQKVVANRTKAAAKKRASRKSAEPAKVAKAPAAAKATKPKTAKAKA
jgi:small subunit ribosomal protein S16